jgi:hypothetical protein
MVEAWLDGKDVLPGAKMNSPFGLICAVAAIVENIKIDARTLLKITIPLWVLKVI